MSSNSTASPAGAGGGTRCCGATTLVAVAATSFAGCFVLVVAFLFVRFVLLRQRWRHGARGLLLQEQHQPKPGLDAAAIALLPSFPYRRRAGADGSTSVPADAAGAGAAECAVCLGVLDEGQMVRQLSGCKHVFHQECIDVWLATRASCPVCRGKAEPPARAEDRAAAASAPPRVAAVEMLGNELELASSSTPVAAWLDLTAPRQLVYSSGQSQ